MASFARPKIGRLRRRLRLLSSLSCTAPYFFAHSLQSLPPEPRPLSRVNCFCGESVDTGRCLLCFADLSDEAFWFESHPLANSSFWTRSPVHSRPNPLRWLFCARKASKASSIFCIFQLILGGGSNRIRIGSAQGGREVGRVGTGVFFAPDRIFGWNEAKKIKVRLLLCPWAGPALPKIWCVDGPGTFCLDDLTPNSVSSWLSLSKE